MSLLLLWNLSLILSLNILVIAMDLKTMLSRAATDCRCFRFYSKKLLNRDKSTEYALRLSQFLDSFLCGVIPKSKVTVIWETLICLLEHLPHPLQKVIHRRNRETTRRPIPQTPSRRRERQQKRI